MGKAHLSFYFDPMAYDKNQLAALSSKRILLAIVEVSGQPSQVCIISTMYIIAQINAEPVCKPQVYYCLL